MEHRVAGDAVQRAGRQVGRVDHAVLHQEDVLARAFGDEAVDVEQQPFVVAVHGRLQRREHRVGIRAGHLGARHGDVDVMPCVGRSLDADAFGERLGPEVGAPGPGGDRHVHLGADRRDAHLLRAVEGDRADVAGLVLVGAHHLELRLHQPLARERNLHQVDVRRGEQAVGVLLQTEDGRAERRLVGAHALEHRQAVVQRMREDVRSGVAPRHQFAVVPDPAVAVGHRHRRARRFLPLRHGISQVEERRF